MEKSVGQEIQILTNEPKEIEVTVGTQLTTLHGNKLKFKCPIREGVIGIDWLQNGRIISSGDKYFVVKEKLKIGMHNVTCQVTGEMGKTEITSFIQIQGKPLKVCIDPTVRSTISISIDLLIQLD